MSNTTSSSDNDSTQSVYPANENNIYFETLYLAGKSFPLLTKVSYIDLSIFSFLNLHIKRDTEELDR